MQPDPIREAEARAWLARAAEDLRAAEWELKADPPLVVDILFHAQQLAEKSLKAFLARNDTPFRKTRDLGELGRQCIALDGELEALCRRAGPLTVYAWIFRYPGEPGEPSRTDAVDALKIAREVLAAMRVRMNL